LIASGDKAPIYIDPAGNPRQGALPAEPPFVFKDVTSRVFPLKANMARLAGFCDEYLNTDIPPTVAYFKPSLPYVYLMVLNYGSMAAQTVGAQNVGWVSQHEVTFTVPLEWWREEKGRLVFKDWACVSPFIFVDDQMSLTTGREVYGWPKVMSRVDPDVPLWTNNPLSGERLFSLSVPVFPKLYAGRHEEPRVLVQIDRIAGPAYSTIPLDPNNPWNPFAVMAEATRAWLGMTQDALEMFMAPRIRGYSGQRGINSIMAMYERAGINVARLLPDFLLPSFYQDGGAKPSARGAPRLSIQNITLKQFRAVEDPNDACYQALVTSRMGFDRLNKTGFLGDLNMLRGDPSGGFTVRMHRYPSWPIIESLGLDVAGEYDSGEGVPVALLKPALPFWTDVDLHYDKGRVICSRASGFDTRDNAHYAKWVDEQDDAQGPPASAATGEPVRVPYNTALGAATQPVSGPFTFPDVTMQVFPLLAERAQLDGFVQRYLNEQLHAMDLRFETCGSYVYMVVTVCDDQLGSMWSSSNNIGWWADREVSFAIPVRWHYRNRLAGLALVTPFIYADNGRAVITDREVNGRPTVFASIEQPPDVWLTPSGPVAQRNTLRLATEIFPALNLGQRGAQRTLLEIDEQPLLPDNADVEWRRVADVWGARMVEELRRKTLESVTHRRAVENAKALSLELLAHHMPFNWITLKQYRDASRIDCACYQAVVQTTRSITRIYDWREIDQPIHVRVHRSPGHPIVEALGLVVKSVDSSAGSVVENLQPTRPFWMRVAMQEDLGSVVAWRAGDDDNRWLVNPEFLKAHARAAATDTPSLYGGAGETRVGSILGQTRTLDRDLETDARRDLESYARGWLRKALVHELAWMRVHLPTGARAAQTTLRGLSTAQRHQLDRLRDDESFLAVCDAMQIDEMIDLTRALAKAKIAPPSRARTGPSKGMVADLKDSEKLSACVKAFKAMPEKRRAAMALTMPTQQRAELQRLRTAARTTVRARGDAMRGMVEALERGLQAWAHDTDEVRRLTYREAADTIQELDEVQLVIESILSDEWMNCDPNLQRERDRRPEQCVPVYSVYGEGETLKAQREQFARQHGLRQVGQVWCVPPPPIGIRPAAAPHRAPPAALRMRNRKRDDGDD
jgi:hypothetical protein